jgi:ribosomal protein S4E
VPYLQIPTRYLVAMIDGETNKLKVLRINGTATVVEQETDFTVVPGRWYRLSVETLDAGAAVVLNVTADAIDLPVPSASLSVVVSNYGSRTGLTGLYSDRSYTYFNLFKVEN